MLLIRNGCRLYGNISSGLMQSMISQLSIRDDDEVELDEVNEDGVGERLICCCCLGLRDLELDPPRENVKF